MTSTFTLESIQELFITAQSSQIFNDQKTMADADPLFSPEDIMIAYHQSKNNSDFDLKQFILDHFRITERPSTLLQTENHLPITEHLENLWTALERNAKNTTSALLELPYPYIVPGGRFNEFFYWDSYFIMLGLQKSGKHQMMEQIVANSAYLIHHYGFIPNASRSYFLSRSQPPYFSLMVELLAETLETDAPYIDYLDALEKEYQFWMKGSTELKDGEAKLRVVRLQDGSLLNRHYDTKNEARPESYQYDMEDSLRSENPLFFQNIRAACESGLDFSSRWFEDPQKIETICILDLVTVDLNALLYHLEITLKKAHQLKGSQEGIEFYTQKSELRRAAIQKYFWNPTTSSFADYNFIKQSFTSSEHMGIAYPLFFHIATPEQAQAVAHTLQDKFLYEGGLVTTTIQSGQQWDFPNAWAPFQWLAYKGLKNYDFNELSEQISENWCTNVERVYQNTGKLMEKYDATDIQSLAGGGEYPNQFGFGWTNGVYLQMKNKHSHTEK